MVNGQAKKAKYTVQAGDVISYQLPELEEVEYVAENIPLEIVYEDADVAVVNKPQGMVVHPSAGHSSGTLVNALLYHIKDLSGINGVMRPGIVHRIDKDTSGLLMIAKHDQAHTKLAEELKGQKSLRNTWPLFMGICQMTVVSSRRPLVGQKKIVRNKQLQERARKLLRAFVSWNVLETILLWN